MAVPNFSQLGPAQELSTVGCSNTHNNILQILQKTALERTPPKAGPGQ